MPSETPTHVFLPDLIVLSLASQIVESPEARGFLRATDGASLVEVTLEEGRISVMTIEGPEKGRPPRLISVMSLSTKSKSEYFTPYEYDTSAVTIVKFRNGAVGKCAAIVDCIQPYYFRTHLMGSHGSLLDNKLHSSKLKSDKSKWSTLSMKMCDSGDVSDHPYQSQFQAFFDALDQGKDMPLTSFREALRTFKVIFAADRSAAEGGKPVKVA